MSDTDTFKPADDCVFREMCSHKSVEWDIKKFFDQPFTPNIKLRSQHFLFCDSEWFLQIYPNGGSRPETSGWVSLYLYKQDYASEVSVALRLGIKKADGSVFESFSGEVSFGKKAAWGRPKLVKRSVLFESKDVAAPNGVVTVFCHVRLLDAFASIGVEADLQNSSPDSVLKLSLDFTNLYLTGCQSDVIIKAEDKKFKAHSSVLAARSSVFRAMFEADMVEKKDGSVNIEEFKPKIVDDFLKFLYSGKLDVISSSNAVGLYMMADKYDVNELKEPCCDCLERGISVESIFEVINLARLHDEKKLLKTATDYFVRNACLILSTPKWLSFMGEYPPVGNELLLELAKSSAKTDK